MLAFCGLAVVWSLATVRAQAPAAQAEYSQDDLDPNGKDYRKIVSSTGDEERNVIVQMCNGETDIENGRFENYFKKIVFPHFTRLSVAVVPPDNKKNLVPRTILPLMRAEFKKTFFSRSITNTGIAKTARDKLNGMLTERLYQIANNQDQAGQAKNYHPLVRFHAAMFLGELMDDTAAGGPPYRPALKNLVLLSITKSTPNVPDSIRVIALKGVLNHLRQYKQHDPTFVNVINKSVVEPWLSIKDLPSKELPATSRTTHDGLDWIQRRVIEIAVEANAKAADPTKPPVPRLPELLLGIAANEPSGVEVRLAALNALAGMKDLPATVKIDDVTKAAGMIGVAAVRRQLTDIQNQPVPPDAAKPLKHDLTTLETALTALSKKSDKIAKLQQSVDDVKVACDTLWEETQDPNALYKSIQKTGAQLDMLVGGKETSSLNPDFVKIPKGFSGGGAGGTGFGGFRPGGGGGGER
ncbi:MAG: hypothetical protein QM811_13785 [Pirellulales bacterium]